MEEGRHSLWLRNNSNRKSLKKITIIRLNNNSISNKYTLMMKVEKAYSLRFNK